MKEKLLKSIGWISEKSAIQKGFTHDGRYFGIPCWINMDKDPIIMQEKHILFVPITLFFVGVEWTYNLFLDEDFDEIGFMFKLIRKL